MATTNSTAYFVTEYYTNIKGVRTKCRYQTKKLTEHHAFLRTKFAGAVTKKYDPGMDWPFGLYVEIVG